jgi:hypothetical protein
MCAVFNDQESAEPTRLSLNQIYFLLHLRSINVDLPAGAVDPLSDFAMMTEVVKESVIHSHPNLHQIWTLVLEDLLANRSSLLSEFWKVVVNDGLFQSTHMCKYTAFLAFQQIIKDERCTTDIFSDLLQSNLVRCFINSLSDTQTFLHKIAQKTVCSSLSYLNRQSLWLMLSRIGQNWV